MATSSRSWALRWSRDGKGILPQGCKTPEGGAQTQPCQDRWMDYIWCIRRLMTRSWRRSNRMTRGHSRCRLKKRSATSMEMYGSRSPRKDYGSSPTWDGVSGARLRSWMVGNSMAQIPRSSSPTSGDWVSSHNGPRLRAISLDRSSSMTHWECHLCQAGKR